MIDLPENGVEALVLLVGRIDGKMDQMLEQQRSHSSRIADLERDKNRFAGVIACISAAVAWIGKDHLVALFH